jgi:hypothetical protein
MIAPGNLLWPQGKTIADKQIVMTEYRIITQGSENSLFSIDFAAQTFPLHHVCVPWIFALFRRPRRRLEGFTSFRSLRTDGQADRAGALGALNRNALFRTLLLPPRGASIARNTIDRAGQRPKNAHYAPLPQLAFLSVCPRVSKTYGICAFA